MLLLGFDKVGSTIGEIFDGVELNYLAIDTNLKTAIYEQFNNKRPVFFGDNGNTKFNKPT